MGKFILSFVACVSLLLTGCASTSDSSSPTPTQTPTYEAPTSIEFSIDCLDSKTSTTKTFKTYQDAWSGNYERCEAKQVSGTLLSGQQQRAFETSKYKDVSSLKSLYALCASTANSYFSLDFLNENTAAELAGMLTICPEHPLAQKITDRIAKFNVWLANGNSKTGFGPGLYLVGKDIAPGTYRSISTVNNCYWERQDDKGRTIDNDFILSAPSVEVTIQPSDTSFLTDGCSFFELVK